MKQKHFNSTPGKLMDEIMQARKMFKDDTGEWPKLIFMHPSLLPALYHYSKHNPNSTLIKVNAESTLMTIKEMDVFFLNHLPNDVCFMCIPQYIELNQKLFIEKDLDNEGKKSKKGGNGKGTKLDIVPAKPSSKLTGKAPGAGKQDN